MSAPATVPAMTKAEKAAELARLHAEFARYEEEWNDHFRKQGDAAKEMRALGRRIETLERLAFGPAVPDYNLEGGAR